MGSLRAQDLLMQLRARGVEFAVEGGALRVRAPQGVLSPEERNVLTRHKTAIVALLTGEEGGRAENAALSLQQERLWYLDRIEGGLPAYNLSGAFQLDGPLDVGALARALDAFLARHDLLRTVVRERSGRPELEPLRGSALVFDVRTMEEVVGVGGSEDDLRRWLEAEGHRLLPLDRGPLIRFTLIRVSRARHVLFVLVHHIVWDGRCFDIFLRDVGAMYEAELEGRSPHLPPLEARFADYVAWQKRQVTGPRLVRAMEFWDEALGVEHPTLDLPLEGPRPPTMTYAGDRVRLHFDKDFLEAIRGLARQEQVTVYLVLLAAFKALLFRYSRQEDLIVASPIEGRTLPRFEHVVGFFVNTLVIRSAPQPDLPFRAFLRQVRDAFLGSVDHQDTPFEWLVQRYAHRDPSRTPLFQAMFTHQQTGSRPGNWGAVRVRSFVRGTRSATTDLGLWVREYDDYLDGGLDYRTELFERETAEGMSRAFRTLVLAALENPDLTLAELPLMARDDEERETAGRAGPSDPDLGSRSYLDTLRERVRETPGADAVRDGHGAWTTWAELWERSGRVATTLRRHGVQPGDVVGLMVERDARLVPLLVGIHRAGAAYLPLDPDFPDARLEHMVRDSGARTALVDEAVIRGRSLGLTAEGTVETVSADLALASHDPGSGAVGDAPPAGDLEVGSQDLAYLIYTSGSTGVPKAVAVEHGSLANLLHSAGATLEIGSEDVLVAVTTISFDISLLELLLPLCVGARLVVADARTSQDPRALTTLLAASGATVMQATPATWLMLLEDGWTDDLRSILCGGETLPRPLAERLLQRADNVWNLYGPTETTIWSTVERVSGGGGSVPVGRPLHNTRVYVLDASRRPVPVGMRGEIWIAGAGLARGYHDRPELTKERFAPDPFVPGGRMYRTGDLGRWRRDGRLEHLGRIDLQVKVHGFRIELGEIETAIERMEQVRRAVVEAKGTDGDRRLVAYVAFRPGPSLLAGEIRRELARSLPWYMLPGLVVAVDGFPLTPNGKVDRGALPDPIASATTRYIHEEPSTPMETAIASVWQELLGVERVGRHDNFFELGGHSLLSIRATVQIEKRTGKELDPRDFFFRSLAQLAAGA